MASIDLTIKV